MMILAHPPRSSSSLILRRHPPFACCSLILLFRVTSLTFSSILLSCPPSSPLLFPWSPSFLNLFPQRAFFPPPSSCFLVLLLHPPLPPLHASFTICIFFRQASKSSEVTIHRACRVIMSSPEALPDIDPASTCPPKLLSKLIG